VSLLFVMWSSCISAFVSGSVEMYSQSFKLVRHFFQLLSDESLPSVSSEAAGINRRKPIGVKADVILC